MANHNVVEARQVGHSDFENAPIDMRHLEQQSLGDPGLQEEVLRLYSDMSRVYLSRIEASTSVEELLQNLHTLKSAAAGIGAWRVRDVARHAEDALREGATAKSAHLEEVANAVRECREFITGFVSNLG